MTRFIIFILFISMLGSDAAYAQRWKLKRYEASIGIGGSLVISDLTKSDQLKSGIQYITDINLSFIRQSVALAIRYRLTEMTAIKFNAIYDRGYGNEIDSRNDYRQGVFTSNIFEFSSQYEYYVIREDQRLKSAALFNRRGMINNFSKMGLYGYIGVATLLYFPNFEYQTLNEGDIISGYSKVGIGIPAGIGLKYAIDSKWSFGVELGFRYTFTDYLDGFKPIGSNSPDVFYNGHISVIYKIKSNRKGWPVLSNL